MTALLQQLEKEKVKLEAEIQWQQQCLQASDQRAWELEQRVNKLEVGMASEKVKLN